MQQCFHVFAKKQSCGFNAIPHTRAREYICVNYICEVDYNFTFVYFYVCKYIMIHYDSDMLNCTFFNQVVFASLAEAPVAPQVLQVPSETMVVKKEPVVSRKKAEIWRV